MVFQGDQSVGQLAWGVCEREEVSVADDPLRDYFPRNAGFEIWSDLRGSRRCGTRTGLATPEPLSALADERRAAPPRDHRSSRHSPVHLSPLKEIKKGGRVGRGRGPSPERSVLTMGAPCISVSSRESARIISLVPAFGSLAYPTWQLSVCPCLPLFVARCAPTRLPSGRRRSLLTSAAPRARARTRAASTISSRPSPMRRRRSCA